MVQDRLHMYVPSFIPGSLMVVPSSAVVAMNLCVVIAVIIVSAVASARGRVLDDKEQMPDVAVSLSNDDFNNTLWATPESFVLVEFFAHWCPACQNYKPHYEKVARLFNGREAVHPDIVLMVKVDCAEKVNTRLCDRFSVSHYPMLLWGKPSQFAFGSWDLKVQNGIERIDGARTAESLLSWINAKIGKSYSIDDEKFEIPDLVSNSNPVEIARAIYDIEEATGSIFDLFPAKMIDMDSRAALIHFLQGLAVHHPSKRCRRGSVDILVDFDEIWPSSMSVEPKQEQISLNDVFQNFHVCGRDVPQGHWVFCRGSRNTTRGFSCGLWLLFHSLSVRVEDGESMNTFVAICDFVRKFFVCEECRQHFSNMCSSVQEPIKSQRDLVLWLWNAHNKVNQRLMVEEAKLKTGDPKFPKVIWPPKHLCLTCWDSSRKKHDETNLDTLWNKTEVYQFLMNYYGASLKNSIQVKQNADQKQRITEDLSPTSAVTVPIGAAVAIAIASCGFGVVACCWRMQQKKRRYKRF